MRIQTRGSPLRRRSRGAAATLPVSTAAASEASAAVPKARGSETSEVAFVVSEVGFVVGAAAPAPPSVTASGIVSIIGIAERILRVAREGRLPLGQAVAAQNQQAGDTDGHHIGT